MTEQCPFCNLDAERIVFEEDLLVAIWDGFPVSEGHLLIIPKRHVPSWFDATEEEQRALTAAISLGRSVIESDCHPDGFNIGINVGAVAGQTVPHLHLHLIPRYQGDVPDPRGGVRHVIPTKGNYLAPLMQSSTGSDSSPDQPWLVTGEELPFFPHLRKCMDHALSADFAVAFILKSGVRSLREHFQDLLNRGGLLRIVTGDYLDVTDPDALVELLDLNGNIQLRVYEAKGTSFHPKAYLFYDGNGHGTAFVGSSNLTQSALSGGVEWNFRVLRSHTEQGFSEVQNAFQDLFNHRRTRTVDDAWIAGYRRRRKVVDNTRVIEVVAEAPDPIPQPHAIQQEALVALIATRSAANEAGLVVLATGLGKTWLAAFDSTRPEFKRILFVAHREEILSQAMHTFRRIRPVARLGRYTGQEKAPDSDVLFASIQTLGKTRHLEVFSRDHFDYVIVDEFHHAAAKTYRRLIAYFTPKFLLGLTATPERTDGGDLLALCQENLVFRKDMISGIENDLLSPFRYFGVPDDVDYRNIPWRNTRFDEEELTKAVATQKRAKNALEQFRKRGGKRALGFCCSQRHADFMAEYFVQAGVRAVAVHSGERSAPRATALEDLAAGNLDILFAVDMFNEGLDIPTIDTVLMLRPTESSIIWLQQFGRGLRKADGKDFLAVVDYIGNHRSFLLNVRSILQPLLSNVENDAELSAALLRYQQGELDLPPGCQVIYELETIDIIKSLLRVRAADDAIITFYEDFKERHGMRPTATQLHNSGYSPRSIRNTHGSWTNFLKTRGDLSQAEHEVLHSCGAFLDMLETTRMTKSFKMLTLEAMLNRDAFPGQISGEDLVEEFRILARRNHSLKNEVLVDVEEDAKLQSMLVQNPINAWTSGESPYFDWDGSRFRFKQSIQPNLRNELQSLTRELVDWRLTEYLDRSQDDNTTASGRFVCRVFQASGNPILRLPNREKIPGIPFGWTSVLINGARHEANFVKIALNVVKRDHVSEENLLASILQGWFGPNAGQPGTKFEVAFESSGDMLEMKPIGKMELSQPKAELWNHYMREDIPPLFGLKFNAGSWNQGFMTSSNNLFLLVTLEKGGLNKDHRYDDQFLAADRFQWQSQNRTTRNSSHGSLIQNHRAKKIELQLFIRRSKLVDGKAAPFIYCGPVDFEDWKGDAPITVTVKLREPVPRSLYRALNVPEVKEIN